MEFLQSLIDEIYEQGFFIVNSFDSDFIYISDCCGSYSVSIVDLMEAIEKKVLK